MSAYPDFPYLGKRDLAFCRCSPNWTVENVRSTASEHAQTSISNKNGGISPRRLDLHEEEEWYFAIVDVVNALVDSANPKTYWRVLKKRLIDEGNETVTKCNALKMQAADG